MNEREKGVGDGGGSLENSGMEKFQLVKEFIAIHRAYDF